MRRRAPARPPRTIHTAVIEKLSHEGRGIARIDGKTTFISGALATEEVSFQYTRQKSDFDEGRAITIHKAAKERVEPRCPHYELCGGCSLQHLNEDLQIAEKEKLLLDLLQRVGHCQPEKVLPPLKAKSWNYRNKARLSVRYVNKKSATLIGFREKINPRYITEINECPILNEKIDAAIPAMRALVDSLDDPHSIAQIEVAAGDNDVALIFRNLTPLSEADLEKLAAFAKEKDFKIFLQPGGPDTVKLFYPADESEYLTYSLAKDNIEFKFFPTDFTQINASLNPQMIQLAMELMEIKADDVVLDLFCGLGNFSLPLAKRCLKVVGVEGSEDMVLRAKMNAELNQITNADFFCRDLEKIDALNHLIPEQFTKLLIDPPRSGAEEVVKQIDKMNVKRLVYVSCNPATLARDADILVNQKGFRLKAAAVMDMFVHTAHVESIAVFEKG
ncbi:MAG: 23S rRNA (uracil(1939)-C(5))-methyltransferase RlmD [Proteobacteria bacterium]|nr:23S rRNA (uracil(1939)-C(5))-methyltransferase RlmD [Pseudomonadota bacterium]